MKPECERFLPLIVRSADGTLAPGSRGELDAHLASCAECRTAAGDQAAVSRMLGEYDLVPAPREFAARVRARLAPQPSVFDLLNWRAWTLRLAPVAALLALLAWYPTTTTPARVTVSVETLPAVLDEWAGTRAQVAALAGANAAVDGDALLAEALGETSR